MAMQHYEDAIKDCKAAIRKCPDYTKAMLHQARSYAALLNFETAKKMYDKLLDMKLNNRAEVLKERIQVQKRIRDQKQQQQRQKEKQKKPSYRRSYTHESWDDSWDHFFGQGPRSRQQTFSGRKEKGKATPAKKTVRSHYEVLGISRSATSKEIKVAYRKLALKYHPDKNNEARYQELFKDMTAAYTVLSDIDSKGIYDRELKYGSYGNYYEC